MKFYIQIKHADLDWDDIKADEFDFDSKELAIKHAKYLSLTTKREVRLTDNCRLLNGLYFKVVPVI